MEEPKAIYNNGDVVSYLISQKDLPREEPTRYAAILATKFEKRKFTYKMSDQNRPRFSPNESEYWTPEEDIQAIFVAKGVG